MIKKESLDSFDYSQLNDNTLEFIQEQTVAIQSLIKRTAQDIFEIGTRLIEVKEKLEYGRFQNWLEAEFSWDERTARRFMSVARAFTADNLSDLNIAPSALYVLAAPSTSKQAKDEALTLARQGNTITYKVAQEVKKKHQGEKKSHKLLQPSKKIDFGGNNSESDATKKSSALNPENRSIALSKRQEIVKVIPKSAASNNTPAKDLKLSLSSMKDFQSVEPGSWWDLGDKHSLYYGEPNSPGFLKRLPQDIALNLAFPPTNQWSLDTPAIAKSSLALYSIYQNTDRILWRSVFKNILELYTESEEIIVFSFLPDPELIILTEQLGCRCIIADSRWKKCQEILAFWQTMTKNLLL
ncbi:MAG: DUF3102 domain-containing protein [Cyanobacteria bacterium P01_G01_bin.19]